MGEHFYIVLNFRVPFWWRTGCRDAEDQRCCQHLCFHKFQFTSHFVVGLVEGLLSEKITHYPVVRRFIKVTSSKTNYHYVTLKYTEYQIRKPVTINLTIPRYCLLAGLIPKLPFYFVVKGISTRYFVVIILWSRP